MRKRTAELFPRDLKFMVDANPPHRKTRGNSHSHWLATAVITVLVGVWIGSEPSASISRVPDSVLSDSNQSQAGILPVTGLTLPMPPVSSPAETKVRDQDSLALMEAPEDVALPGLSFGPHHASFPEASEPVAAVIEDTVFKFGPTLDIVTGFENLQSDLETFSIETSLDLSAFGARSSGEWVVVDIRKGQTLSTIFKKHGVDARLTHDLSRSKQGRLLNSLRTGPNLRLRFDAAGSLVSLRYNIDATRILISEFEDRDFQTRIEKRKVEIKRKEIAGTIHGSLFRSAAKVGLSDKFVLHLVSIFKWNIDFNRDLQPGDRFSVIYEEKYVGGRKFATGGIVAAAFVVNGKKYSAIRHVDPDGQVSYYNSAGESLKRAFLRSPVKFSRISSQFSKKRFHPVLKRWRAHKGVDYAAGRGTPVHATADGVIRYLGGKNGYGRTVIIQHGRKYQTLYGHLNGYNKKLRKGSRVRQGQVIGYVGSSGLATGPHLHYEFRVNGVHKNPLTVKVPRALPIDGRQRKEFMQVAASMDTRLNNLLN